MHAQLSAGEVPDGSIAYEVNIDLFLDLAFTSDTADLELDCDDFMDARAMLFRGAPEIDAPHVASLQFVDDDIEVCMDMSPSTNFQLRPKYYAFGEVLDCSGDFDWQVADQLVLGDIGGFMLADGVGVGVEPGVGGSAAEVVQLQQEGTACVEFAAELDRPGAGAAGRL